MKKRKDITGDVVEIKRLVEKCPEAVDLLPPFQRKIIQALMRGKKGNTAAKGKAGKPLPSP